MLPGPDQIVACPHCKALASYRTLMSGNTFGARVWTDGKQVAPMLSRPPEIAKCGQCGECFWLADAKEIGTVDHGADQGKDVDPAWSSAQSIKEPSEEEYYEALRKGLAADARQERTLRVLAWWPRNDAFRDVTHRESTNVAAASGTWRRNLEALVGLLDEVNDNDRLIQAEVLRELGKFGSSREVLERVTSASCATIVRQLRCLCDAQDTCVRQLQFGG
jgi:hypothetical protein